MDLTKITDTKELKALAYEQVIAKAQAEQNLAMLQQRIAQLEQEPQKTNK